MEKISVYKNFDSGAVKSIEVRSPEGDWDSVFEGKPSTFRVYKKSRVINIFPKVRSTYDSRMTLQSFLY